MERRDENAWKDGVREELIDEINVNCVPLNSGNPKLSKSQGNLELPRESTSMRIQCIFTSFLNSVVTSSQSTAWINSYF